MLTPMKTCLPEKDLTSHDSLKIKASQKFSMANNTLFYYINTNEIPSKLSHENLISSHVKISPLLWLHNKSLLSDQKSLFK